MEVLVRDIIKKAEEKLKEAGVVDFAVDSWLLAEFVFKINRTGFYMDPMMTVPKERADKYMELVGIRASKIPLQHITGSQEFMGLDFKVNEDVLIPRQDTEVLVEEALKRKKEGMKVLDLCTGSGCILLSILKNLKQGTGVGIDISEQALEVARRNAKRLGLEAATTFILSDLFEKAQGPYDMIVSNPPYIETEEIAQLMPEVRDHEPRLALDGMSDGLYYYRSIVSQCRDYLKEDGALLFEIGAGQGAAVSELLKEAGFVSVQVIKDLAGLDRVVAGKAGTKKGKQEKDV